MNREKGKVSLQECAKELRYLVQYAEEFPEQYVSVVLPVMKDVAETLEAWLEESNESKE